MSYLIVGNVLFALFVLMIILHAYWTDDIPKEQTEDTIGYRFYDDRSEQSTQSPSGASYPGRVGVKKLPNCQRYPSGCLLGCGPCSPLCSGENNPCQVVAPVPSAMWQPQSASTVQYRLRTGNYVPSTCPQGSFALQKAPGCSGLANIRDSRAVKKVNCYTAQEKN